MVRDHIPVEVADATSKNLDPIDNLAMQRVITLEEKKKFDECEAVLALDM